MAENIIVANATNKTHTGTGTATDLDIVSYTNAPGGTNNTGITASLSNNPDLPAPTGWAAGSTYTGVEGLEGSDFHDLLIGNDEANKLYGGSGSDTLYGGLGADTLVGAAINGTLNPEGVLDVDFASYAYAQEALTIDFLTDTKTGAAEGDVYISIEGIVATDMEDLIIGNDQKHSFIMGDGDDTVVGGMGRETMDGGEGIDTVSYATASSFVRVNLMSGGGDFGAAQGDTYTDFENVIGSNFADTLTGNLSDNLLEGGGGADALIGNGGDDVLDGGAGIDVMQGMADNDTYLVDDAKDRAMESLNAGTDMVIAAVSFALVNGDEIEIMRAAEGTAAINLTGNQYTQQLFGNAGNNVLNGIGRDNIMAGREGNDTYYVDNTGDMILEAENGGISDLVYSRVSHTLADYVEHLYGTGSSAIRLTGNILSNTIVGNAGANVINGGSGDDQINGGAGKDVLYGGAGYDTFLLTTKPSSKNYEKLADFYSKHDTIKLENKVFTGLKAGKLSSSAFWKGTKAHDKSDRIIYDSKKGYLYFDADGTGSKYKPVLFATMKAKSALGASDFFVV